MVWQGKDVDLTMFPLPLLHENDGGPYISGTLVVSRDSEYGRTIGSYRLMYRTPNETGARTSHGTSGTLPWRDLLRAWGEVRRREGERAGPGRLLPPGRRAAKNSPKRAIVRAQPSGGITVQGSLVGRVRLGRA